MTGCLWIFQITKYLVLLMIEIHIVRQSAYLFVLNFYLWYDCLSWNMPITEIPRDLDKPGSQYYFSPKIMSLPNILLQAYKSNTNMTWIYWWKHPYTWQKQCYCVKSHAYFHLVQLSKSMCLDKSGCIRVIEVIKCLYLPSLLV